MEQRQRRDQHHVLLRQWRERLFANLGFSNVAIKTPQVADIIAIGNLYGLSTTTRLGDTTYGFNNTSGRTAFDAAVNPNVAYTILDSGGIDTLDYSGFATNQLINLNAEAFSNVGPAIGNDAANTLTGRGGSDILTGGHGADLFRDTIANFAGDRITDYFGGDRMVLADGSLATSATMTVGLSGGLLTIGSTSLVLDNVHNASVTVRTAPEGGVELSFGGPAIIFSSAAAEPWAAAPSVQTMLAASREVTVVHAEDSLSSVAHLYDTLTLRTGDGLFV